MAHKPTRIFVNHGDDENCTALAAKITEQFGIATDSPWSGSCFDLIKGEWISLSSPLEKMMATMQEKKKGSKDSSDYRNLMEAAEALLQYAKGMEHYANSEIRKMTKKINALMEE